MNETSWDAQNLEIEARANFDDFLGSGKKCRHGIFFVDWMLWEQQFAENLSWMLYSDSLREMMQNAVNESFWDAHGVEIGGCANFDPKAFLAASPNKWRD